MCGTLKRCSFFFSVYVRTAVFVKGDSQILELGRYSNAPPIDGDTDDVPVDEHLFACISDVAVFT